MNSLTLLPLVFPWDAHIWWGFLPDPKFHPTQKYAETLMINIDLGNLDSLKKQMGQEGCCDVENFTKGLQISFVLILLTFAYLIFLFFMSWKQQILSWKQQLQGRGELEMEEFHLAKQPEPEDGGTPTMRLTKRALENFNINASPRLGQKVHFQDQETPFKERPVLPQLTPEKNPFERRNFSDFGQTDIDRDEVDGEKEDSEEEKLRRVFKRNADKIFNINRFIDVKDNQLTIPLDYAGGEGGGLGTGLNQFSDMNTVDDSESDWESSISTAFFSGSPTPSQCATGSCIDQPSDNTCAEHGSVVSVLVHKATGILPNILAVRIRKFLGFSSVDDEPKRIRYVRAWYNIDCPPSARRAKNTNP